MRPFRKPFFGDPAFPFEMVHRATKYPQFELPDHLHDRCEIVYVHSGRGTFFIDDTLYEKAPGDLFLIPGDTIHRAFPDADDPIVSVEASRRMVEALRELGADVQYTEYEGVGHNAWDPAYAEFALMPWLLSHRRPKE